MESLTPDVLILLIKLLAWVVGSMSAIGLTVFSYYHKQLIGRLDKIDIDIKPIGAQLAVHSEQIEHLQSSHAESTRWLNNHDGRIQTLERKVAKIEH